MTMSQAATEPHVGPISYSNGCNFDNDHRAMEPMDLSGSQASTSSPEKALMEDDMPPGTLCRRSTRASALKAQEKIKLKDDVTGMEPSTASEEFVKKEEAEEDDVPAKKRKIADPSNLDQMSSSFYIQQDPDGEVIEIEEETEISSINSEEAAALKEQYDKIVSQEPSAEQLRERNSIIKNLEAELRREESKLTLMRKIVSSQHMAKAVEAKKLATSVPLNNGSAYKPAVATPKNGSTNKGSTGAQNAVLNQDAINILLKLGMEQQKDFIIRANKTNPQVVPQLVQSIARGNCATPAQLTQLVQAIQAAQQQEQKEKQAAKEAALKEQQNQQTSVFAKNFANATPAQRAAQARQAFRLQADKQLSQIANYKAQPADLSFIPNPTQPDFCSLVALDIIVQRVLKDKAAYAEVSEVPYECEQCGTDFTPSWKAIGPPEELHLYCEQCVRETTKKKNQKDHTAFLRKAFNKVATQEKEFEKQIADGKLDAVVAAAAAQQQAAAQSAASSAASTSQAQNLSTRQNGTNTPTQQKSSTPVPAVKHSTPSSSTSTPQAKKTTSSSSSAMNLNQLQQAQLAMLMRNPMMAAMMQSQMSNNQMMMQQVYNPMMMQLMMQQMQQQQQQQARSSQQSSSTNSAFAMAALMQAAAQSSAQGGSSSGTNANIAALAAMNPQLLTNPQLMRQVQAMQQQLKNNLKK